MATNNPMGKTYIPSRYLRYVLTERNLQELNISGRVDELRNWKGRLLPDTAAPLGSDYTADSYVQAVAQQKDKDGYDRKVLPTGFSINNVRFGDYPDSERTARARGWLAYMNKGEPLIDERSDIVQPRPDVISEQVYVNRTDPQPMNWENSVEFSIENEISWSLDGTVELTFSDSASAELEQEIEVGKEDTIAGMTSVEQIMHDHPEETGGESHAHAEVSSEETNTVESTSEASGTGEVSAELMLGITGEVSGSLRTGWTQTSTMSGTVGSRVVVRASQRRQVRRYDYTIPIIFGGYVALYYPEPVKFGSQDYAYKSIDSVKTWKKVQTADPTGNTEPLEYVQVIVFDIRILGIVKYGEAYAQKGWAEVVSTLAGEHEVFEPEALTVSGRNKGDSEPTALYKY